MTNLRIYFCTWQDEDGRDDMPSDTLDVFVRCVTPEEAVEHWREHYKDWFAPGPVTHVPIVYLVPPIETRHCTLGALQWRTDVPTCHSRYHDIEAAAKALGLDRENADVQAP